MANLLSRISAALKGFRHPSGYSGGYLGGGYSHGDNFITGAYTYRPGDIDFASTVTAEDIIGNSAVMACLGWIMDVWPEAPLKVYAVNSEGQLEAEDTPSKSPEIQQLQRLIRRPNNDYGDAILWMGTVLSLKLDGNAYWHIDRNAGGVPIALRYIPHGSIEPKWPRSGDVYISHYEYRPGGTSEKQDLETKDIVHFREGIDPANTRKGLSRVRAVLREIYGDNVASEFTATVTDNWGVMPYFISPHPQANKDGQQVTLNETQAKDLKDKVRSETTGKNKGKALVSSIPLNVQTIGTAPDKMALRDMKQVFEERICAVFRIPPGVVKLGAGLQRNTYNNAQTEQEQAYRNAVMPLHRLIRDDLEQQLLPQFFTEQQQTAGLLEKFRLGFDITEVSALQEDEDERAKRWALLFEANLCTRATAKQELQIPVDEGDEVYYADITQGMDSAKKQLMEESVKNARERRRKSEAQGIEEPEDE